MFYSLTSLVVLGGGGQRTADSGPRSHAGREERIKKEMSQYEVIYSVPQVLEEL